MMCIKRKVAFKMNYKKYVWEHNKTAWLTFYTKRRESKARRSSKIIIVHLPIMCETTTWSETQCRTYDFCFCLLDKYRVVERERATISKQSKDTCLLLMRSSAAIVVVVGTVLWARKISFWSGPRRLERCHVNLSHTYTCGLSTAETI